MAKMTILWHEKDSENCADILPSGWFAEAGVRSGCVHDVRGPRSGAYQAKCDVSVHGSHVDLDYSPYARFNEKRGMFLGVMRIVFEDESRRHVTQVLWRDEGRKEFVPAAVTVEVQQDIEAPDLELMTLDETENEGRKRLVSHFRRERSAKLVAEKKAAVLRDTGRLACEVCGFDFAEKYGDLGEDFCEIHHRVALSSMDEAKTSLSELAVICSNCHRMIHRTGDPMMSIAAFAERIA